MKSRKFRTTLPAAALATTLLLPTSTATFASTQLSTTTPPLHKRLLLVNTDTTINFRYSRTMGPKAPSEAMRFGKSLWMILKTYFH